MLNGLRIAFQFNEDFIKNYNEENDKWYFLEVDVRHPENFQNLHTMWGAMIIWLFS